MRLLERVADKLSKQPENVAGHWYVDMSCALCRMCLEEAPNLITYNRDETAVHFFKQPETAEEIDAAQQPWKSAPHSRSGMRVETLIARTVTNFTILESTA